MLRKLRNMFSVSLLWVVLTAFCGTGEGPSTLMQGDAPLLSLIDVKQEIRGEGLLTPVICLDENSRLPGHNMQAGKKALLLTPLSSANRSGRAPLTLYFYSRTVTAGLHPYYISYRRMTV